jgi:hypothetical protein
MSLLGKLGSVLDPGEIVKNVVNTALPKELGIIGDLAGAAIDIVEENPAGAAKHALEALRDLPQAAKAVSQGLTATAGSTKSITSQSSGWHGTPSFEPRPPAQGPQVNVTVNGGQVSITINETAVRWPRLQAAIDSVWHGSVHGAPNGTSHGAVMPTPSAPASSGGLALSGASGAPAAPTASAGGSINSVAQMNGLSDAAFMNAVRDGKISPDVAKDPNAMLQIQERMNRITQMNQLMSQMLAAMHQMAMSTIQNIRA